MADSYEPMTGCHAALIHHVAMSGVVVSVASDSVTSTRYGHRRTMGGYEGARPSAATTLGTGAGGCSSSLVIRSVRCAGIEWLR